MYHYVRPYNENMPHLKKLDIADFIEQLNFFESEFGIISEEDFLKSMDTGIPADGVVLTFDDALKCHYDYVYPELKKRNLWGIFYVPTQMYIENKLLDVHRIHLLLAMVNSEVIYKELLTLVTENMLPDSVKLEFKTLTYTNQINDNATNLVKRILNYYISYGYRNEVINKLMATFIPNEVQEVNSFYITKEEIAEMESNGMTIGSHTVSHPVLSKIDRKSQAVEIIESFQFLGEVCNRFPYKTFCYPYGGFHSFTAETEQILMDYDCKFSFNVENRDIQKEDLTMRKQALPRYDCNQFKHGQIR